MNPKWPCPLFSRRILIVEDDFQVAISLRNVLKVIGAEVAGPVDSVEKAIGAIESEPDIDAAIVDADLGGVMAYPVADRLITRNIPFVFVSGYGVNVLHARYPRIASFRKPYAFETLERALSSAMSAKDEARKSLDGGKNHARG
jgi:DNA-binding NtrC family response regulator